MDSIGASGYAEKLERLDRCARLDRVDRVPIGVASLYFPAKYSGISYEEMYYDQDKYLGAAKKFARDFNWDAVCFLRSFESVTLGLSLAGTDAATAINVAVASVLGGGFAHDILRDVYSSQPGRELPSDNESQFTIKQPLMSAEEYDEFIADPFGFLNSKVVPRVYGALSSPGSGEATTALVKLGMGVNTALSGLQTFTQEMKTVNCPPWYIVAGKPSDAETQAAVSALQDGMAAVGNLFEKGEYFIGDLIFAGELLTELVVLLKPGAVAVGPANAGKILLGTVKNDLHDIGKNIFKSMAKAAGFEVHDLGIDQAPQIFVDKVREIKPDVLGLSGVLTLAVDSMKSTIEGLKAAGLRDQVKVIIGGACASKEAMNASGADAWTTNAAEGVKICLDWVKT